jgi:hypothetical protein
MRAQYSRKKPTSVEMDIVMTRSFVFLRRLLLCLSLFSLILCVSLAFQQYPKLDNYNSRKALKAAEYADYKELYYFLLSYSVFVITCGTYDLTYIHTQLF